MKREHRKTSDKLALELAKLQVLLAHDNILRETHHRTYDNAQTNLTHNLELTLQTLLFVAKDLDI
ncbi:MAG: hypothetical protein IIX99_01500, partial [Oscillospiraceae bacterium]|nr:hypothetical protein [Oscillospiraceae bacterium]